MALSLIDVPTEAEVISQIIEKTLQNGMLVEVYLVKYPRQYESALFIEWPLQTGASGPAPCRKSHRNSSLLDGRTP